MADEMSTKDKVLLAAFIAAATAGAKWLAGKVTTAADKAPATIGRITHSIKDWWQGKTIAIIGATASGKNSMFSRLRNEEPPTEHVQTRGTDKVKSFKVRRNYPEIGEITFTCRHAINVGGETDERDRFWAQACTNADFIFYLVDMERLKRDSIGYINRIKEDLRWLSSNANEFKHDRKIHILLNKVDLTAQIPQDADDHKKYIVESVKDETTTIESIATNILDRNASILSGVSPISMKDKILFNAFFNDALRDIYEKNSQS